MIVIERFRKAREDAGLSQSELARRVGVRQQTIASIESGAIKSTKAIYRFAAEMGVQASFLDPEIPAAPDGNRLVPLLGYVGAGAEIFSIDDHEKGASIEEIPAPPGVSSESVVALRVRGDSMLPVYKPGDLIFYDKAERGDLTHLLGKDVIVHLDDGRTFLKELRRSNGDLYLHSHNAEPIFRPKIAWAAKVRWIERA